MKILHIGLTVNGRGEGLSEAFINSGHEYKELPVNNNLPDLLDRLDYKPDLIFCQIQSDFGLKIVDQLKKLGGFVINWTGDIRGNVPSWMFQFPANVTAFSNMRDVNLVDNSEFLQIGFDPKTYKDWSKEAGNIQGYDVVFMGNDYGNQFPLSEPRRSMVYRLKNKIRNFGVFGNYPNSNGSLNPDPNNPFPIQSQESKIYSNSLIAVNYSHYDVHRYTSDRMFRALGSRVMVLSHNYKGINEDFEIGHHLDVFNDLNDLEQKINYYLSNDDEREQIALNGFKLAHEKHTYKNMVEDIIKIYESRTRRV